MDLSSINKNSEETTTTSISNEPLRSSMLLLWRKTTDTDLMESHNVSTKLNNKHMTLTSLKIVEQLVGVAWDDLKRVVRAVRIYTSGVPTGIDLSALVKGHRRKRTALAL